METMTTDSHTTVIDTLFGDAIEWDEHDSSTGYISCPGESKHTGKTGRKDCRIYLSGVPTVFCLHQHCKEACDELTENVRGALRANGWEPPPMTADVKARATSKNNNKRQAERVADQREACFKIHEWTVSEITDNAVADLAPGVQLDLFLNQMFTGKDQLWLGTPYETGESYSEWFAPRSSWMRRRRVDRVGPFICPNPMTPGAFDRSLNSLADRRYFVIEGDDCHPDKDINRDRCGAIFKYAMECKPELNLRAIVDAGNKSLHGWFEWPGEDTYKWCLEVLPAFGADPATMRLAQPVRLPGVTRDNGKEQRLLWISK